MTAFLWKYLFAWLAACLAALIVAIGERQKLQAEWPLYRQYLFMRWKLALFLPALLFVTFAGRFTNDETWDVISGGGMSIATFLTAPWAIGIIWKFALEKRSGKD